ncbi:hypothetical protein LguiA_004877 [Lonicera macranthoides]
MCHIALTCGYFDVFVELFSLVMKGESLSERTIILDICGYITLKRLHSTFGVWWGWRYT